MKSIQGSVQALVVSVDMPKHSRGPAESFLLSCVLEREIPQIATTSSILNIGERCFLLISSFQKDKWKR